MKHERSLESQTRRVDREKSNVATVVRELPQKGREGDLVHLGEPPAPSETPKDGYYLRLHGEWRFLETAQAETETETPTDPDGEVVAPPRNYLAKVGDTP